MEFKIINADCMDAMRDLIDQGIMVDSIVTDPPYELGFMGKKWDASGIAYNTEMWQLCMQLLKPGGHLLSFGGSRTYHRMAVAIEDAGFEIRDCIMWIYGQGFPKSLNISKAIDKAAGAEREVVGKTHCGLHHRGGSNSFTDDNWKAENRDGDFVSITKPATDDAKKWEGWGTALKPAVEPIVVARKPLSEKTVAENVLKHGTGGLNIDGCRITVTKEDAEYCIKRLGFKAGKDHVTIPSSDENGYHSGNVYGKYRATETKVLAHIDKGRFPANLIHDGSEEVLDEFAKYGESVSKASANRNGNTNEDDLFRIKRKDNSLVQGHSDKGTAARFYYSAKASKKDRMGSKHPTVKPISLMRYLCRLVTPKGGTVLDPFAGIGSTGQAAIEEGFNVIMIEREAEYIPDIERRMESVKGVMVQTDLMEDGERNSTDA